MIEFLEMMQCLVAIEHLDVLTLRRSETAHSPAQMHKVRLDRGVHGMHADLAWETVGLARVAGTAGRYDVRPVVAAAP